MKHGFDEWTHRGLLYFLHSPLQFSTGAGLQVLGCVPFSIFINGLEEEEAMQGTLIKFGDDSCLRAGLPFLGRLEEWANRNLVKSSKD